MWYVETSSLRTFDLYSLSVDNRLLENVFIHAIIVKATTKQGNYSKFDKCAT